MVLAFTTSLCGGIGGEGVPGLFRRDSSRNQRLPALLGTNCFD